MYMYTCMLCVHVYTCMLSVHVYMYVVCACVHVCCVYMCTCMLCVHVYTCMLRYEVQQNHKLPTFVANVWDTYFAIVTSSYFVIRVYLWTNTLCD